MKSGQRRWPGLAVIGLAGRRVIVTFVKPSCYPVRRTVSRIAVAVFSRLPPRWRVICDQYPVVCGGVADLAGYPPVMAQETSDAQAIRQAALDCIESQYQEEPQRMKWTLHKELAKRTYWQRADGQEFVMETCCDTMSRVAASYHTQGDKFPKTPKKVNCSISTVG